jgi:hypothetical protein
MRAVAAVCAVASSLTYGGHASANVLDRPLNDKPTVRTEIVRGTDTAFACGPRSDLPTEEIRCMTDAITADRLRHPDGVPFRVGVLYGGCYQLSADYKATSRLKTRVAGRISYELEALFSSWVDALWAAQNELHISDAELATANGENTSNIGYCH